jgi:hypothetical protein
VINLREQIEHDLGESLEREWKMPVELTDPDGQTQIYSVNNPTERLGGQVLYFSRQENPVSGETIVIKQPVVSLRISSLIRVPVAGETWYIKMPTSPRAGSPWISYFFTADRAPEDGADIGFIRIYPQRARQSSEPVS